MKPKHVRSLANDWAVCPALIAAFALSLSSASGQTSGGKPEVIEGFTNTPMLPGGKWHMHDPARPQPTVVTPGATFSQAAPPPSDAELLFDGKDLSKWQLNNGNAATWKVQDGYMEVAGREDIRTRGKWADMQVHLEFSEPNPATGHGQGRGNSGVEFNGMYEVQINDCYQDKTYPDGQAGGIYGQMPPLVNPARPPGEWQTYDIIWESPRWDATNGLVKKACVTVFYNGVLVQNHTELIGTTDGSNRGVPWKSLPAYKPHPPEVFIDLQSHNANPVRFRNIWVRELHLDAQQ